MAILAILVSSGAASYIRAPRNARDLTRTRDLNQVKTALEQYFEINLEYPTGTNGKIDCSGEKDWGKEWTCDNHTYMRTLPIEPSGTLEYCYVSLSTSEFSIYGNMENASNGNTSALNPHPACLGTYNFTLESEK